jgi:hypothetical protein
MYRGKLFYRLTAVDIRIRLEQIFAGKNSRLDIPAQQPDM